MSKPLRILIVEDEAIIAENLQMALEFLGYSVVGKAKTYTEAVLLLQSEQPDLALVDIMLSGARDGVDVANEINKNFHIPFIFLTSHADKHTVERAKEARPNGYLVKPYERDDLYAAIEVAVINYSDRKTDATEASKDDALEDSLFVKRRDLYVRVRTKHICWIESADKYVDLHTAEDTYVLRYALGGLLETLSEGDFIQVHRSFAVNLDKVTALGPDHVFVEEHKIPIGRAYKAALLDRVNLKS